MPQDGTNGKAGTCNVNAVTRKLPHICEASLPAYYIAILKYALRLAVMWIGAPTSVPWQSRMSLLRNVACVASSN
jgi:hypothetical protein